MLPGVSLDPSRINHLTETRQCTTIASNAPCPFGHTASNLRPYMGLQSDSKLVSLNFWRTFTVLVSGSLIGHAAILCQAVSHTPTHAGAPLYCGSGG